MGLLSVGWERPRTSDLHIDHHHKGGRFVGGRRTCAVGCGRNGGRGWVDSVTSAACDSRLCTGLLGVGVGG